MAGRCKKCKVPLEGLLYPPSQRTPSVKARMNATRCFGGCRTETCRRIPAEGYLLWIGRYTKAGKQRYHACKGVGLHKWVASKIFGIKPSEKDPELCNKCESKK